MAFILYLLYLCSIILFLYIEVIINGEHLNNRSKRIYRKFYCRRGIKTKVWCVGGDSSHQQQKYLKNRKIHFLELDFAHPNELRAQLSGHKGTYNKFDYIIHCAGVTKCPDKNTFDYVNYLQTKYFIDTLKALNMVPKQFIYISTLSVFGPVREKDYSPIEAGDVPMQILLMVLASLRLNFIFKVFPVSLMLFIALQEFTVLVNWIIS